MTRRLLINFCLLLLAPQIALAVQARSLPPDIIRARIQSRQQEQEQADRGLASTPQFTYEELQFNIANGKTMTARLMIPLREPSDKQQRLPVLTIFGGFERAAKVLDLIQPKVPLIVASFDYPFAPPRKFVFPESLKFAPVAKQAIPDMLEGIDQLHALLKQRDDVDASKITIAGASFGTPFALAAAAADPSISGVVIVHGFGDIPGTAAHQLLRKWTPRFGVLAKPMAWVLSHAGWLYLDGPAPEQSARRLTSRQRVLMISAQNDSFIPTEASNRLSRALEESSVQHERLVTDGDHLQPGANALIEKIIDQVTAWMTRSELL